MAAGRETEKGDRYTIQKGILHYVLYLYRWSNITYGLHFQNARVKGFDVNLHVVLESLKSASNKLTAAVNHN